jgi:hypothetical protein
VTLHYYFYFYNKENILRKRSNNTYGNIGLIGNVGNGRVAIIILESGENSHIDLVCYPLISLFDFVT